MLKVVVDVAIFVVFAVAILGWDQWKKSAARAGLAADARQRSGIDHVACGQCGAHNAEKVKARTRAGSAVAGGIIFSRKARAQFHCRSCGLYW